MIEQNLQIFEFMAIILNVSEIIKKLLLEDIISGMNSKDIVGSIFVHLTKAIDCVNILSFCFVNLSL